MIAVLPAYCAWVPFIGVCGWLAHGIRKGARR
jgi:hypothetical protein